MYIDPCSTVVTLSQHRPMAITYEAKVGAFKTLEFIETFKAAHGEGWLHYVLKDRPQYCEFIIIPLLRPNVSTDIFALADNYFELYDFVNVCCDLELQPVAGQLDSHSASLIISLPAYALVHSVVPFSSCALI